MYIKNYDFKLINLYFYKNLNILLDLRCSNDFILNNYFFKIIFKKLIYKILKLIPNNLNDLSKLKLKNFSLKKIRKNFLLSSLEKFKIGGFFIIKSNYNIKTYLYNKKIGIILKYKGVNKTNVIKNIILNLILIKFKFLYIYNIDIIKLLKVFLKLKSKIFKKKVLYENFFLNIIKKSCFIYKYDIINNNKINEILKENYIFIKSFIIYK